MTNQLFFGDNLKVLKNSIKSNSIDLIYLDPPFNSSRDYNQIFINEYKESPSAQLKVFNDT